MARRRKIPVRKHHGIRDPLKQKEKLERSLKNSINNPPTKDDQNSTKFARFKKLLDDTASGKKLKKIRLGGQEDRPSNSSSRKVDSQKRAIKQFSHETDEEYLSRVNRITRESIKEAQYENKFGVNVIRDSKTGAITIQKRPKNEIDELIKQKAQQKRAAKGGRKNQQAPIKQMDPKLAKQLVKQAIKEDDEERANESAKELQEFKHDIFKFGEVVHAPPTLSTLPRRAQKNETVPRPGKKHNLLLQSMLGEVTVKQAKSTPAVKTTKQKANSTQDQVKKSQLKGKRKELPAATRLMLENERIKMVEIYRQLKKSKEKSK